MASAYLLMKNNIEEKYPVYEINKEYYIAEDGSTQELTKEKELEMLYKAYQTHSQFMATSIQAWNRLQDFKMQTVYYTGRIETEVSITENPNINTQKTNIKNRLIMHLCLQLMRKTLNC